MKALVALTTFSLSLVQAGKPPKTAYDKVRDETEFSTGVVSFRRGSSFSYWALFFFRGKEPVRPDSIILNFYARRLNDSGNPGADADFAKWAKVDEVVLRWGTDPKSFPAKAFKYGEGDDMMKAFVKVTGSRTFVERLRLEIPTDTFIELANAKELLVGLGEHSDKLGEGTIKPMKLLAESIPAKK
jgi:hypothetical protein